VGSLRCDVSVLSFSDLFVHLFNSGKQGILTVFQGTMKKSFYVSSEGVSLLATTGEARSLGEMLIRTRKVTRAQLDRLLDEKAMRGQRLAELVQRYGLVTAQDVEIAKRDHVEEELHELFTWRNAVCEFQESPPPRMIENFYAGVVVGKAATALMLESARRSDELAKIMSELGDEQLVPMVVRSWNGVSMEEVSADQLYAVYRGINGQANIAEVIRRSLYPRLEALRALHAFVSHKYVTLVNANQATELNLMQDSPADQTLAAALARGNGLGNGNGNGNGNGHYGSNGRNVVASKVIALLGEMLLYKAPLARILKESGYVVKTPSLDAMADGFADARRVAVAMVDVGSRNLNAYPLSDIPWESSDRRVIAIGRDSSLTAKKRAFEQGANVYAVMPFTKKNILGILSSVLSPIDDLHLPFYTSDIS
jgi:hypothetical protein